MNTFFWPTTSLPVPSPYASPPGAVSPAATSPEVAADVARDSANVEQLMADQQSLASQQAGYQAVHSALDSLAHTAQVAEAHVGSAPSAAAIDQQVGDLVAGINAVETAMSGSRAAILGSSPFAGTDALLLEKLREDLQSLVSTAVSTPSGNALSLADIGVSVQGDGSLALDPNALQAAEGTSLSDVNELVFGLQGIYQPIEDLVEAAIAPGAGTLTAREAGLSAEMVENQFALTQAQAGVNAEQERAEGATTAQQVRGADLSADGLEVDALLPLFPPSAASTFPPFPYP